MNKSGADVLSFLRKIFKRGDLSTIQIDESGKRLTIDSVHVVDFQFPIKEAFQSKNTVVVFLDPNADPDKTSRYGNLLGFDRQGNKLWVAEFPQSDSADVYWGIEKREPLNANTFSSYECRINVDTGKIERAYFYK